MSLKSKVALTREIAVGESVGYGREFVAERNSRLALLPIVMLTEFQELCPAENAEVLLRVLSCTDYRKDLHGSACGGYN